MTDYTGLKRLCAALISANEAYLDDDCNTEKQERFHDADDALQDALPPEVVLAIIAENELLRDSPHMRAIHSLRGDCADLMAERDQLKGENEAMRKALDECADSLHSEMLQKFGGQLPDDMHPVTRREYDRDMAEVAGYRAAMGKGEQS